MDKAELYEEIYDYATSLDWFGLVYDSDKDKEDTTHNQENIDNWFANIMGGDTAELQAKLEDSLMSHDECESNFANLLLTGLELIKMSLQVVEEE